LPSSKPQSAARRPRRDPRRDRNRKNLVESALHLVAAEGTALTVARVSREAGIDPSGFYAHFKNIEECELAAAEAFRQYTAGHMSAYAKLRTASGLDGAIAANEELLRSWLSHPEWVALSGRCRYDDSAFGKSVRELLDAVRRDFTETLWDRAARFGIRGKHLREIEGLAELCIGLFNTTLERLNTGRGTDVRAAAEQLAHANYALVSTSLKRMVEQDAASARKSKSGG
jgi:AcrR family transcriptional regulator